MDGDGAADVKDDVDMISLPEKHPPSGPEKEVDAETTSAQPAAPVLVDDSPSEPASKPAHDVADLPLNNGICCVEALPGGGCC